MPNYTFKRAPSLVTSDYKVISDGDKYSFFRGTTSDYYNVSAACVVNYGVAQNIISASSSWEGIFEGTYNTQKSTILSILGTTPNQIYGKKVTYYAYSPDTTEIFPSFFAIRIDTSTDPGLYFSETVNYNEKTLEFNILRNNNPAYVQALVYFLTSGGVFQNNSDQGTYESFRAAALNAITSEGGDVEIAPPIDAFG